MALPSSGQLSFSQIYAEVYGSHTTQQCSMFAMATSAGKTTTDININDWYGYSSGSSVVYDFSDTITTLANTVTDQDYYRSLDITGRESGQIYSFNFNVIYQAFSGTPLGTVRFSKNSTSSWVTLGSYGGSATTSVTIPNIDHDDVIRIRLTLDGKIPEASLQLQCNGGTVTTGTGTVTSSGTTNWTITIP